MLHHTYTIRYYTNTILNLHYTETILYYTVLYLYCACAILLLYFILYHATPIQYKTMLHYNMTTAITCTLTNTNTIPY